jgi:GTPase SAR1 family protein
MHSRLRLLCSSNSSTFLSVLVLNSSLLQNRTSFENIRNWHAEAAKVALDANRPMTFLLLANKIDLTAERSVSNEEGKALADSLDAEYYEVSAKTNTGIDDSLRVFTKAMIAQATGQLT